MSLIDRIRDLLGGRRSAAEDGTATTAGAAGATAGEKSDDFDADAGSDFGGGDFGGGGDSGGGSSSGGSAH